MAEDVLNSRNKKIKDQKSTLLTDFSWLLWV